MKYSFTEVSDQEDLHALKQKCLGQLSSPPDGMWQSFRSLANQLAIFFNDDLIGYACVDSEKRLIQFYLLDAYVHQGLRILSILLRERNIDTMIVGTNNPLFLSLALRHSSKYSVDTLLFRDYIETATIMKAGTLTPVKSHQVGKVVNFLHDAMGAPKAWLNDYISDLSEKASIYMLLDKDLILGTCEVRRSATLPKYADIGMVVSSKLRRQGYGSYLLQEAKNIAIKKGLVPICSCEKDNIGSLKAIQRIGFLSKHCLLKIES